LTPTRPRTTMPCDDAMPASRYTVRSLLKKGTGTSPGALLGGVIGHELGASPLPFFNRLLGYNEHS
jgi:uncharacterized protein YcfJ